MRTVIESTREKVRECENRWPAATTGQEFPLGVLFSEAGKPCDNHSSDWHIEC